MARAVFLDRDGVLNADAGYTFRVEDLKILDGVPAALKELKRRGFLLVVITNQSGVARGYFDEAAIGAFHRALDLAIVAGGGAALDAYFYCPHLPDAKVAKYAKICACRKPAPGLVLQAVAKHGIDIGTSYLVGDRESDVACAVGAKVRAIQILHQGSKPDARAFATATSLSDALRFLV